MTGLLHPGPEDRSRETVVRVYEDEEIFFLGAEGGEDGMQCWIVEARAEAGGAEDDALDVFPAVWVRG